MGVAVGEDEAADPLGMAGDEDLRHGAAGVVADDRHVLEVERLEEGGDRRGDPGGERSASGFIAICWAPIGQSGAKQR